MASRPKLEKSESVLVVEGYGDLLFYAELLEYLGVQGVYIQSFNGRSDLQTKLETFLSPLLVSSKRHIGVIVDADDNPQGITESLKVALSKLTNQQVAAQGWTQGPPCIGLFVVPGGDVNGEIETLVWRSWATAVENGPAKQCIETFKECMSQSGMKPKSPDKALIGALLSIRHDDDPRLGPAARAGVFNFDSPELAPLRNFLSGFQ